MTVYEKQTILLNNLYGMVPKDAIKEALEKAMEFLNGGVIGESSDEASMRLYSFSKDASFIFSAFRQTHGIDLQEEELHWWKFLALFMDLGADTTFSNLIGLRKRVKTGKATKEERQIASDMGDMFEIEELDTRTYEERRQEDEFLALVGGHK